MGQSGIGEPPSQKLHPFFVKEALDIVNVPAAQPHLADKCRAEATAAVHQPGTKGIEPPTKRQKSSRASSRHAAKKASLQVGGQDGSEPDLPEGQPDPTTSKFIPLAPIFSVTGPAESSHSINHENYASLLHQQGQVSVINTPAYSFGGKVSSSKEFGFHGNTGVSKEAEESVFIRESG
ncbi:hypothetical protein UVI_02003260 [Ustilaginoidea virens]|uniref:Uncharacterized protein n=1 Tax=Ustilaginoidea virens TaxID=1159556 RepID=A0A1B5L0X8_USTVR|nr:hypothetical protein UVI_02003260 [Ustilaginoidea virens]